MKRPGLLLAVLLALLCAAGAAWADPFSAVAALSTFAGAAAGTTTFLGLSAGAWFYVGVAASVLGAANSRRKARKAQAAAKAEYNAGLQDRTATVLRTDPPWQVVYGRCIVGGFYSDIITTDKVQPNEVSDAATKPDAYKTAVVVMAAHEVEDFHEVYIDGIPIGPVDVDGWAANGASATVTFTHGSDLVNWTATPATDGVGFMIYGGTAPTGLVNNTLYYVRDKTADSFKLAATPGGAPINFTSDGSGTITGRIQSPFFSEGSDFRIRTFADELTFTEGPLLEVLSAYTGTGDTQMPVTVTIESGNRLVSAAGSGVDVTVNFSFTKDKPTVRVGYFHGAASQTTPAMLAEIAPSRYTSDHRMRGCAGVIVTLDLEDVRFQGGPPQITADLSGRLLFDPRDDTTAWSNNPALVVRDFLTAEWGFEVDEADVDDTTVAAAADACDELIDLVVGSTTTTGQPRFTCNGAFQTDASKESTLADLVDSMGGAVSYGATYRLLAGTWTAPVLALTDDDLHGQIEVVQADTPTGELFNGIRGQLFLAGAQSPSDFNPYQNATFAADDGRDLWTSTSLPFTNHLARARNLSRIAVEQTRSGQVIRYPAKMVAWPLEIGDRVTVTSAEYGLTTKAYRVTDWQWDTTSPVVLTLQEDAEEIYDLADAAVADPTPNTGLTDPWAVPALDNVAATSGNTTLVMQGDGTIVPRVLVTWDAVANGGVSAGGRVEVLWRSQSATAWNFNSVPGADTSVYLYGCTVGDTIIIEARARNSLSRVGPSVYLSHVVAGKTDAPQDVADFAYAIKPGQVALTWDPCTDDDYDVTEIRVGASWAAGTFGWAGKASERNVARPPNGTYVLWAKHVNRSGVYSVNAATVTVVVDDSIDSGGGVLVLEIDGPPIFRFADGTTHTTADPDLTLTARLVGLFGEAAWTATAYDAMTGGSSLGAVTLTGTGNARVLTGAAFVAPGTSGSVRRVDVVATLDGASDTQAIYRYDPTVTGPFLYLSNPTVAVGTDEAGLFGDYSRANTVAAVLDTGADVTSTWTLVIEPDTGLTSTINGGAGPITGTASVTVAVSASTIPDGVVLIRASKSGETDLTAPFRVVLKYAQGVERLLYFAPRTDIVLPVDAAGTVTSFTNAWTNALVRLKNGTDVTDQYTFTKTDENVTSTLVAGKVSITAWVPLGTFGTTVSVTPGVGATGWERPAPVVIFGDGVWVQPGLHTNPAAPFSVARRSTDYEAWDDVSLPATEHWSLGSYTDGAFVLANNSNSNQVLRSTDGGVSFSAVTLPITNAFQHVRGQAGTFLILPNGHTTGLRSTDGGASWSSITVPSGPFDLWGVGINRWLFKNSSTGYSISTDNGTSWSSTSPAAALKSAIGFRGIIVAAYSGASTNVAYSEDSGATWADALLPASVTDGKLLNLNGVLYLYGSALVHYSLDGKRWQGSGATVTNSDCWCVSADEMVTDIFPLLNNLSGIWAKMPLLATAATEGAVHVTASTPGEEDLTATLPVQLGAVTTPTQVSNINPAVALVPSTADGVVTDFTNASFAVTVVEASLTVTSDYAWTWTATHLTPSSGTGSTATFTDMDDAYDSGRVSFVGVQAGKDPVRLGADVVKLKGTDDSGIVIGAAYTVSSVTNTYVEIRLTSSGVVEKREGSSGSWERIGQWAAPEGASAGAGAWVRFDVLNTPDGTSTVTGTTGSFLALTSTRGISLSDTSTGTHKVELVVYLSPNSGGTLPRASLVTLLLIVP